MKSLVYLFALLIIFSSCHQATTTKNVESVKDNTPVLVNSLDEFKARFNKVDYLMPITKLEIKDGTEINTFETYLDENILIDGEINKSNNTIREVRMITKSSDNEADGNKAILALIGVLKAVDTTLDNNALQEMMHTFRHTDDQGNVLPNVKYEKDGVEYLTDYNDSLGIVYFTLKPVTK